MRRFSVLLLIALGFAFSFVSPPLSAAGTRATDFYVVAHMANNLASVDWAVERGANAVEMDLQFWPDGAVNEFRHGSPCDCTCRVVTLSADNICTPLGDSCNAKAEAREMMRKVASKSQVALLFIDSKVDGAMRPEVQRAAGVNVVNMLDEILYGSGYRGKVVVSAGNYTAYEYIVSAANRANEIRRELYFAFDQIGKSKEDAATALAYLTSLPRTTRAVGTGISSCAFGESTFGDYRDAVRTGSENEDARMSALTYVWTIDSETSMNRYIDAGARAILTNFPGKLAGVARGRNLTLATPGAPMTIVSSNNINDVRGPIRRDCSCDYRQTGTSFLLVPKGGCRINTPALPNQACRCRYMGAWTCRGDVTGCSNSNASQCRAPDGSKESCELGGGDCGGY